MVKGREEIGVRGSIWARVFIEGAGGPGGVRLPWAKMDSGKTAKARNSLFIGNTPCQFITLTRAGGKFEKEKRGPVIRYRALFEVRLCQDISCG